MSTSSCSVLGHQGGLLGKKGILIKLFTRKTLKPSRDAGATNHKGKCKWNCVFFKGYSSSMESAFICLNNKRVKLYCNITKHRFFTQGRFMWMLVKKTVFEFISDSIRIVLLLFHLDVWASRGRMSSSFLVPSVFPFITLTCVSRPLSTCI